MNTYQIISKRNAVVLATVEASSRIEAVAQYTGKQTVTAVLA